MQGVIQELKDATVLGAIITVAGGLVSSLIVALLARFGSQHRVAELEERTKRLVLIQEALSVRKSLGDASQRQYDLVTLENAYLKLIQELKSETGDETKAATQLYNKPHGQLFRFLVPPRPKTFWGWLFTVIYYYYAFAGALAVGLACSALFTEEYGVERVVAAGIFSLIVVLLTRWGAESSARAAVQRATSLASS